MNAQRDSQPAIVASSAVLTFALKNNSLMEMDSTSPIHPVTDVSISRRLWRK
jgi:hypothetical protein